MNATLSKTKELPVAGGADDQLVEICRDQNRHFVTLDLDFADIVRHSFDPSTADPLL